MAVNCVKQYVCESTLDVLPDGLYLERLTYFVLGQGLGSSNNVLWILDTSHQRPFRRGGVREHEV